MAPTISETAANCQVCYKVTHRRCSTCEVCVLCTPECEQLCAAKCSGRVACALHIAADAAALRAVVDADVSGVPYCVATSPTHFVMAPDLSYDGRVEDWSDAIRCKGAEHFVKYLLAWSPTETSWYSCFGMSVCGHSGHNKLSAGVSRIRWANSTTENTFQAMVARHLTLSQELSLRDGNTKPLFVAIGGVVKHKQSKTKHAVHFDLVQIDTTNSEPDIHIYPLWVQFLDLPDNPLRAKTERVFKLNYMPNGIYPTKSNPALTKELVIAALATITLLPEPPTPEPPTPEPAAASASTSASVPWDSEQTPESYAAWHRPPHAEGGTFHGGSPTWTQHLLDSLARAESSSKPSPSQSKALPGADPREAQGSAA